MQTAIEGNLIGIVVVAMEVLGIIALIAVAWGRDRSRLNSMESNHDKLREDFEKHEESSTEYRESQIRIDTNVQHILRHLNMNGHGHNKDKK